MAAVSLAKTPIIQRDVVDLTLDESSDDDTITNPTRGLASRIKHAIRVPPRQIETPFQATSLNGGKPRVDNYRFGVKQRAEGYHDSTRWTGRLSPVPSQISVQPSCQSRNVANPAKRRKVAGDIYPSTEVILPYINDSLWGLERYGITAFPSDTALPKTNGIHYLEGHKGNEQGGIDTQPDYPRNGQLGADLAGSREAKSYEKSVDKVLRDQVLPYVKRALDHYSKPLSTAERKQVAKQVTNRLVTEAGFQDDFVKNNGKLSDNLQLTTSVKVDQYVKEYARTIAKRYPQGYSGQGTSFGKTSPIAKQTLPSPLLSNRGGLSQSQNCPSVLSEDVVMGDNSELSEVVLSSDEVLDQALPDHIPVQHIRSGSISLDSGESYSPQILAQVQRASKRRRYAQRFSGCASQARDHIPTFGRKLDRKQTCKVRRLRLAGLAPTLPGLYLSVEEREDIKQGLYATRHLLQSIDLESLQGQLCHVNFEREEVANLCNTLLGTTVDPVRELMSFMTGKESSISDMVCDLKVALGKHPGTSAWKLLHRRGAESISAFLEDAVQGLVDQVPSITTFDLARIHKKPLPHTSITSVLSQREMDGMNPVRLQRGLRSLGAEVNNYVEDSLTLKTRWTDCCGDISAISWTSNVAFICGAIAHSDLHNMQYNKPGNLLVGSSSGGTLKSYAAHKIKRPVIGYTANAENARESMRQTQSPWLYTSVVATAYSEGHAFTASFDKTVKVWDVSEDGSSMDLRGTWHHDGKVNFVVTSSHHSMVATASDVSYNAIRVYKLKRESIEASPYDIYTCDKVSEDDLAPATWAYFPATIQWGLANAVRHCLLVGFSPRSLTEHEHEIPEERRDSGQLTLWNAMNKQSIAISSATSANVFEVLWHPSQPIFLAATAACGTHEPETKTQVRIYAVLDNSESPNFTPIKILDCVGIDINELTMLPTSLRECYVTASCTDGNTYVWETAYGDKPIHVLSHGDSLDNPIHDLPRELADTGVKFASWGRTSARFYTGSSDGKVKAWDIEAPSGSAFVRDVLTVSGGICAGAFSPDHSQLLLGDATGKVHLLTLPSDVPEPLSSAPPTTSVSKTLPLHAQLQQRLLSQRRRPVPITPHQEPAPPACHPLNYTLADTTESNREESAATIARRYLLEGQLSISPFPLIGVVQGPNYTETMLYNPSMHIDGDPSKPLLPEWQMVQQCETPVREMSLTVPRLGNVVADTNGDLHKGNLASELDLEALKRETRGLRGNERVDLAFEDSSTQPGWEYAMGPSASIFRG